MAGCLDRIVKATQVSSVEWQCEPHCWLSSFKQRGWTLGQNLKIEYRIYNGDTDLAHRYARELISLKPDVLYAVTSNPFYAILFDHNPKLRPLFANDINLQTRMLASMLSSLVK